MSQSNKLFGALVLAFVIYVTVRGQLPDYLSLFSGESSSANANNSSETSEPSKSNSVEDTFKKFNDLFSNMGLGN